MNVNQERLSKLKITHKADKDLMEIIDFYERIHEDPVGMFYAEVAEMIKAISNDMKCNREGRETESQVVSSPLYAVASKMLEKSKTYFEGASLGKKELFSKEEDGELTKKLKKGTKQVILGT